MPPKLKKVKLSEFRPAAINPNAGNQNSVPLIRQSIEEVGAGRPMLSDKDGEMMGGSHSLQAFMDAGYEEALVVEDDGTLPIIYKRIDVSIDSDLGRAMGQSGDYIGGRDSTTVNAIKTKRKAMNTFICSVDRPFQFMGRINEDVNAYVALGHRGGLFLTCFQVSLTQTATQQQDGGMTDLYLNTGTYRKSFYTVMFAPSCTRVSVIGPVSPRLHHSVDWDNAVPKIIRPDYQKGRDNAPNG